MTKLWVTTWMMSLARMLYGWADWLALQVSGTYGVEDLASFRGSVPDHRIFFCIKASDGMYRFHGILAENPEEARKQAWKIPGSLVSLKSFEQMKLEVLNENYRRCSNERVDQS